MNQQKLNTDHLQYTCENLAMRYVLTNFKYDEKTPNVHTEIPQPPSQM